eukprot:4182876-Pyramimonas_sp.AAC.1
MPPSIHFVILALSPSRADLEAARVLALPERIVGLPALALFGLHLVELPRQAYDARHDMTT